MDNFREWLSDNLRYFMLGGAILIVVLVLFFSIRACTAKNPKTDGQDQIPVDSLQQNDPSGSDSSSSGNAAQANPMQVANEEVTNLIRNYYQALGEKDVEALRGLVEGLSITDESRILNSNDYIESYQVNEVYTKAGMTEGSYIVYAVYDYICSGIETPVPAMSQMYVTTGADGKLMIDGGAEADAQINAYITAAESDEDYVELKNKVQKEYDEAQANDEDLRNFLAGLGEDAGASTNASDGTMLTANDDCNVRAAASTDADIIGGISAGEQIQKIGVEGEWVKVDYEGETGYIYGSLLDE